MSDILQLPVSHRHAIPPKRLSRLSIEQEAAQLLIDKTHRAKVRYPKQNLTSIQQHFWDLAYDAGEFHETIRAHFV